MRNRVSVQLDFTLARTARLFLIVRGPTPSCKTVGFISVTGRKGHNTVAFAGRVQGHRLEPGVYLISLSPTRQVAPGAPTEHVRVVSPRRTIPLQNSTRKPTCNEASGPAAYATSWIELVEAPPASSTARPERPIAQIASAQKNEPGGDDEEAAGLIPDIGAIGGNAAEQPFLAIAVLVLVGALLLAMVALVTRFLRGSWNP